MRSRVRFENDTTEDKANKKEGVDSRIEGLVFADAVAIGVLEGCGHIQENPDDGQDGPCCRAHALRPLESDRQNSKLRSGLILDGANTSLESRKALEVCSQTYFQNDHAKGETINMTLGHREIRPGKEREDKQ